MSLNDDLAHQLRAFHHAILDDCDRASRPQQTDEIALLLRTNAVALAKLQLAILAHLPNEPVASRDQDADSDDPPPLADLTDRPDHLLVGDALSRFVSRRLGPDESPHEVWQQLQQGAPAKVRRNPALPRSGFRSSSG